MCRVARRTVAILTLLLLVTISMLPAYAVVTLDSAQKAGVYNYVKSKATVTASGWIDASKSSSYVDTTANSAGNTQVAASNGDVVYIKDSVINEYLNSVRAGTVDANGNPIAGKTATTGVADASGIDDMVSKVNVSADIDRALTIATPLTPIVETFLGVLAYAIIVGLPIFTALDVIYITVPLVREKVQSSASTGGAFAKGGKHGDGGVRWVSTEAQKAVEEASNMEGKSALRIYVVSRLGVYVMCALVLYMLLGGSAQVITTLAVKAVSGIMGVLQGLSLPSA